MTSRKRLNAAKGYTYIISLQERGDVFDILVEEVTPVYGILGLSPKKAAAVFREFVGGPAPWDR